MLVLTKQTLTFQTLSFLRYETCNRTGFLEIVTQGWRCKWLGACVWVLDGYVIHADSHTQVDPESCYFRLYAPSIGFCFIGFLKATKRMVTMNVCDDAACFGGVASMIDINLKVSTSC
jgi:hypothetical protein